MNREILILLFALFALVVLVTWRLAQWWHKRTLDAAIARVVQQGGFAPSEEFLALLRRPTVDGVARRVLKRMGLANWADVLLLGVPMTLVCHDKAALQAACDALKVLQADIETQMRQASAEQTMAALDKHFKKPGGGASSDNRPTPSIAPTILRPPPPPPSRFRVIDGGAK